MSPFWFVLALLGALLLGGFVVYYVISYKVGKALGRAFGLPTPPWWKFW